MSLEISLNLNSPTEIQQRYVDNSTPTLYKAIITTISGFSLYKISQTNTFSTLSTAFKQKIPTLDIKTFTPTKNQALIAAAGLTALAIHQHERLKLAEKKIKTITSNSFAQTAQIFKNIKNKIAKGANKYKQLWETNTFGMLAIHALALAILVVTCMSLKKNFNQEMQMDNNNISTTNNEIENTKEHSYKETINQTLEKISSKTKNVYIVTKSFFTNIKNKITETTSSFYEKLNHDMESQTDYPYKPSHNNDFSWLYPTPSKKDDEENLTSKN